MDNPPAASFASGEMMNSFDDSRMAALPEGSQRIVHRRRELLGPAYRLQYALPVRFVRGSGVFLYDETGQAYLDAYNNVTSLGHCHPRVVDAISSQLSVLNTNTRYLDAALLDYAQRLLDTHADSLDKVMFTCTGSKANDLAVRIARPLTGPIGGIIPGTGNTGTRATMETGRDKV